MQRGVPTDDHGGVWWRTRGGGTGHPEPTPGLDLRVNVIPRAKRGELRDHHRPKTHPAHWRIPPSLRPGALTGLEGGPAMLPVPRYHIVRGTIHQHQTIQ